ncbi:MAG: hypothetical protein A3C36_04950 [Omnitrophica WOR_2 bacterium RIFCSPHIGHO2_02_FULL_52_10]|nr:MAG: hypothetical protein A3C36_04950 [Omnitrophica WOR_2 bacterium RIFCSPHIGHO2_02_FULL_52_10]
MKSPRNHVLIFDFDGTIADTFHKLLEIGNRLSVEFDFKKIEDEEVEELKHKSARETIAHLNIPLLKIPQIIAKAKRELNKEIGLIKPIHGLKEILIQLKSLGLRMGILTSNSLKNVHNFLDNNSLNFFDFVQTTPKIWSKNRSLMTLIDKQHLKIADVIYIGDETRDIIAAQKAGIRTIAVTWGYNSRRALENHRPDFLIHSPQELYQLFNAAL